MVEGNFHHRTDIKMKEHGERQKPNQIRHQENLAHFTGFWHGTYFYGGMAQLPKEERPPTQLAQVGLIFSSKKR